jgi:uncharacterized membrane protein YccC
VDPVTHRSLVAAISCLVATLTALWMGLDQPYWAAITAYVIANVDATAFATKAVLRIAGTLLGCILGYGLSIGTEGAPVAQAIALFLVAAVGTYGRFRSRFGYAWILGAASVILLLTSSMVDPIDLYSYAYDRCYEILIGVTAAALFAWGFGARGSFGLRSSEVVVTRETALLEALAAGVGAVVVVLLWSRFDLPSMPQVVVTSLVVVSQSIDATRLRGLQRMIGCLLGGCFGLLVILVDAANFAWWAFALMAGVYLTGRLHLSRIRMPMSERRRGSPSCSPWSVARDRRTASCPRSTGSRAWSSASPS